MSKINYKELGIKSALGHTNVVTEEEVNSLPVYKIPLDLLKFNEKNGRIISIYEGKDNDDSEGKQRAIEKAVWESTPQNNGTKQDIQKLGQLEAGIVDSHNWVIRDGNRRFSCLRRLNKQFPDDERFQYFKAAIIDKPEGMDDEDFEMMLKKIEIRKQMAEEQRIDYDPVDQNLNIYQYLKAKKFSTKAYEEMAKVSGKTVPQLQKITFMIEEMIDPFLKMLGKKGTYKVVRDLKIWHRIEPFAAKFKGSYKEYTPSELAKLKEILFMLATALQIRNPAQNLIKDLGRIYDNPVAGKEFINSFYNEKEYDKKIMEDVFIPAQRGEDILKKIKEFQKSDTHLNLFDDYDNIVREGIKEKKIKNPTELCNEAIKKLNELNFHDFKYSKNQKTEEIKKESKELLKEIIFLAESHIQTIEEIEKNEIN